MTASTLPAVRRRAGEWGWVGLALAFLVLLACWPLWSDDYGLSVVRDILVPWRDPVRQDGVTDDPVHPPLPAASSIG